MDWFAPIDIYCERTDPSFWAEPWNAVSNAAFILAGLWGFYEAHKRGQMAPIVIALCSLAVSIGIGSFLFHTYANVWSSFADTGPIWSFVALFVLASVNLFSGKRPGAGLIAIVVAVAVFVVVGPSFVGGDSDLNAAAPAELTLLNGSEQYLPAVVALLVFTIIARRRANPFAPYIATALALFAASLTFRTLDMHLCTTLPTGTHALWHSLNGIMIGVLLTGFIRTRQVLRTSPNQSSSLV